MVFGFNFGAKKGAVPAIEKKSSMGWKTTMAYFLAGALSMQALESSAASLTPEEKKHAVELMLSSPEKVLKYETEFLAQAESLPMVDDGFHEIKGIRFETGHKIIRANDGSAVRINYENGKPISVDVRTPDDKDGVHKILSDGSHGEPLDGRIDGVTSYNNKDKREIEAYKFIETVNAQGEKRIEFKNNNQKVSPEGVNKLFVDAQRDLEQGMRFVSESTSTVQL